jgi:hypothetical protein
MAPTPAPLPVTDLPGADHEFATLVADPGYRSLSGKQLVALVPDRCQAFDFRARRLVCLRTANS